MAIRTSTTRTTRGSCEPSAESWPLLHADFSFSDLAQAYFDCRRAKRNSASALRFELDLERNLVELDAQLRNGTYKLGRSVCFVITHPKPREVWAADFRDRIVHHLLYNEVAPSIHARFIADSCACIPGRGTLYGAQRLERKVRSITQNWTKDAYYLKLDLANFFVSIDKRILGNLLDGHVRQSWWRALAQQILFHDPRTNYELQGSPTTISLVPKHKRLTEQKSTHGLPIGNLSSQFFANIYLNELDQFVKHQLLCRHYIRYVDDFVLLHESAQWLNDAKAKIETFLAEKLSAKLAPQKTVLQPVRRGIDFVGQIILPFGRVTRKRSLKRAVDRVATLPISDLRETANSYFGLLRQCSRSHNARLKLARAVLRRGKAVDYKLTKTYA